MQRRCFQNRFMNLNNTPSVAATRVQAVERRTFWESELERARAAADHEHAEICIQFISDYDSLISDLNSLDLNSARR